MKKTKLEQIDELYIANRQKGHTTALVKAAAATDNATIIVHSQEFKRQVLQMWEKECPGRDPVRVVRVDKLTDLIDTDLGPILVDNCVFFELVSDMKIAERNMKNKIKESLEYLIKYEIDKA